VLGLTSSSSSVDRVGRSGGLAMFWNSSLNCQVFDYSQNHISIEVIDTDRGNWRLTGYYGYPNGGRRRASFRPMSIFTPKRKKTVTEETI
jgi:hypothetical protein